METQTKPNTELAKIEPVNTEIALASQVAPETKPKTAQEMRVVEVTGALTPAYEKAGTLEITDDEAAMLQAPFPDEAVEIRPHDGLIYLPHIEISDRLNKVFKPGRWVTIKRREWFDDSSSTMFAEYVLIIRGCYVGESIGGHPYAKNNPKINMSDVLESTRAEALRRIAGKTLSCGSQVWKPEYARQWVAKYAEQRGGKWNRKGFSHDATPVYSRPASKPAQTPAQTVSTTPSPTATPKSGINCDGWTRQQLADKVLEITKGKAVVVLQYLQTVKSKSGSTWLMENEGFEALLDDQLNDLVKYWHVLEPKIMEWAQNRNRDNQEQRNPNPEPLDVNARTTVEELDPGYQEPNTNSAPAAPEPEAPADDRLYVDGAVSKVSVKAGTSAKGKKWTLYGVQIGELWYNTFDTKHGEIAQKAKDSGSTVRVWYEQAERGNNLLDIKEMDVAP